jgi:asparagine synthase (glutamine-hydrolysing)
MCGITGYYNSINNITSLNEALDLIQHRGPDDSGTYVNRSSEIGLGHRRLSIIDTSTLGHQPMLDSKEKIVLVFNGEIYNYKELRIDLIKKGFTFKGDSDTEVLLNLYISKGTQMLSQLNGIFSFAIWDENLEQLFLARDSFGVKPLYYSISENDFCFSSEIKSLLSLMSVGSRQTLDTESISRYLSFLWCPGSGTPLKSVKKLPPGEAIIVKNGCIVDQWPWFQLPVFNKNQKQLSKEQSISGVRSDLRQAVHRQMVSDVPVGAFLSGGLDSSSIVAFAKEVAPDIRCFSIDTRGKNDKGFVNDLPYAKLAAKYLDVPLDIVTIDSHNMANDIENMIYQLDEPLADPAALNVLYISQLARQQGIKVLLSGAGGDDLFTGYRRHYALKIEKYWNWMPKSVRVNLEGLTGNLDTSNHVKRRISKLFSGASLSSEDRLINYFRWTNDTTLESLFVPELWSEIKSNNPNAVMYDFIEPIITDVSRLDCMLALEQRYFLTDHNLNYTDKMSMAVGVETRVPFLDKDLVKLASRIPNKYKQKGSIGKWVLKKAMEPYLPKEIIYRPKTGFGVPLRGWIKHELRDLIGDLLSADSIRKRGLFSPDAVNCLILDNKSGKIDASYTILSLLCIEIWCRKYL